TRRTRVGPLGRGRAHASLELTRIATGTYSMSSRCGSGLGKVDRERCALPRSRLYFNLAVVHLNRAINHRETDAAAFRLGREVNIEDPLQVLRLDAASGVRHYQLGTVAASRLARQPQGSPIWHRLTRVQRQVQNRLAQHRRIAVDLN